MFNSSILPSYSCAGTVLSRFFTCTHYLALLLTKGTELCLGTIVHLRCYVSFFLLFCRCSVLVFILLSAIKYSITEGALYNIMFYCMSFRLELISLRDGVSHTDPPSPLLSVTSKLIFFL